MWIVLLAVSGESWAQGTIYFVNHWTATLIAPVYAPDGRTFAPAGSVYVQLQAGPAVDSLAPVGVPVLLGPRDGFYDGGDVTIPTVAPQAWGWFQVRAWDVKSASFEDARARGYLWGETEVFPSQTGGPPPNLSYPLFALKPIILVPEPGPGGLLALGGGLWLLAARRRVESNHH